MAQALILTSQTPGLTEDSLHKFSIEASTLFRSVGIAAGSWPQTIETTLGNGLAFVRFQPIINEGEKELAAYEYRQSSGCIILKVFND